MQRKVHWPTILQLGLSLSGSLALWGIGLTLFIGGATQIYFQGVSVTEALQFFLFSGGMILMGTLLLPSALYAFLRLTGSPSPRIPSLPRYLRPTLLIFALPVILVLGHWVSGLETISWFLLPVLHILGVGLPVLWLIALSLRDLPRSSGQRTWGVFGTGLVFTPMITFISELFIIILVIFVGYVWVYTQPNLLSELRQLTQQMESLQSSPEAVLHLLETYLNRPVVIFGAFTFLGVVIPLIEEMLKPLGVWLMGTRGLSEAEGFALGVLSGAGFALAESLALAGTGSEWAISVFARIGTGVIHILNTGLMGWALARAFGKRDYVRLGLTYLITVLIHGLWNSLSISLVFESLLQDQASSLDLGIFNLSGALIPYALSLLALLGVIALLRINRILAHNSESQPESLNTPTPDIV